MSRKSHHKAFVSSTFEDLKDHRAHVIGQLRRAGFSIDPMEDWTADTDEPKQFSQDRIEGCDLCVLLVAFRRGYVPEGETRSISQLEYEAAIKRGIDILPFMLDDDALWRAKFDEREKDPELVTWCATLRKRHGTEFFTHDPHSIDLTGALGRWFTKKEEGGIGPDAPRKIEWPDDKSPYPGLLWFDETYAPLFFGRDREVDDILAKMSEPLGRFLLISGASGSGKSSLVDAGLRQALLKGGRLLGSTKWIWLRITPGDGNGPFDSLAWGLKQTFPQMSPKPGVLAHDMAGQASSLTSLLASHLASDQELVLFLDQLEELFTQGFKDEEIQRFLAQLIAAVQEPRNRLRVVATVRSEFIGKLEESEPVLQVLNAGCNYHVGPVSPRMLQEIIENPAQATGYTFEAKLVEKILDEEGKEPGSLPLVAYALKQLFERRVERMFTHEAYQAMGGIAGAIGTKADEVLTTLGPEAGPAFDLVFAELVHPERERPPTRKRAPLAVFTNDPGATTLIQELAGPKCRVLVTGGKDKNPTVEIAHEKLFTAWPQLKAWLDESGGALRLIEHAEEAARRWSENGERLEELWLGQRVQDVHKALQRFGKIPSLVFERFLNPMKEFIAQLHQTTLSHRDRMQIGFELVQFGDPLPGIGLRADGLPDIGWIEIPPGQIKLEDVEHVFEVQPFRLAKYPVTNIQFQAFIDAKDGYENEEWWQGLKQNEGPVAPSWSETNCPREMVSWYEAVAFCRWLSHRMDLYIRLPTEWEWQQAATGGDPTYEYPWPGEWDSARCNSTESRLNRTTPVGIYPSGVTQQGVMDMAGNVYQWCLNKHKYPDRTESAGPVKSADMRVIRGGSWNNEPGFLRSSYRMIRNFPSNRSSVIGFRLAQDTP
jgi:hypothetical protein